MNDSRLRVNLDWKICSPSLNTTVEVNIQPRGGLKVDISPFIIGLIEKELEEACSRVHSIIYKELR